MALTPQGRAQAIYNAVKANNGAAFAKLNATEQSSFLSQLQAIFGVGDTNYLVANTQVLPGTFQASAGAAVATTGSAFAQTGSVTAPASVVGLGGIV